MSRRASVISWGDTPLGRIANTDVVMDLPEFPVDIPRRSENWGHVSYRRKSHTHAHNIHNIHNIHRPKMPRTMSAPSGLVNIGHRNETDRKHGILRSISTNEQNDMLDNDDVTLGKGQKPEEYKDLHGCSEKIFHMQNSLRDFIHRRRRILSRLLKTSLLILYLAYFAYAMIYRFGDEGSVRLLVCTIFGAVILLLSRVSTYVWIVVDSVYVYMKQPKTAQIVRWIFYLTAVLSILTTLIFLVALRKPRHLLSLPGLAAFIFLIYITSSNPTKVRWHPVFWGLTIQYLCGVLILHNDWGVNVSRYLRERVTEFLDNAEEGAMYVFGEYFESHHFAFGVLSVTVFFSAAVSVLYHYGVMQSIVRILGRTLSFCFQTSPVEALNVAGNIFIGHTEAPLLIRPFLPGMTRSELHTVMTAGFATVAGNMLTVYAAYGVPVHHLLAACVMSAPSALAISKLSCPETEETRSSQEDYLRLVGSPTENVIEAVTNGATASIKLVANVIVNVIAFICVFNFLNSTLIWFGERVGIESLSFEFICSYLLYPIALFMGVDPTDCRPVARMVGLKIFTNELYAYRTLSQYFDNRELFENYTVLNNNTDWLYVNDDIVLSSWNNLTLVGGVLAQRSEVITTYALCGFSNIGAIGIMLGILGALAPEKKLVLTQTVVRALVAGNVACFITACTAGLLYKDT